MHALEAIAKRRSVRNYKKEQITDNALQSIIVAGNNAPKAGAIHISVIQNPTLLKHIANITLASFKTSGNEFLISRAALPGYKPLYDAPTLLLLSGPQEIPHSAVNCACAAANMTIAATALGLGSCYLGSILTAFQNENNLAHQVGIPAGYAPMGSVVVGYEAENETFSLPQQTINNVNYVR